MSEFRWRLVESSEGPGGQGGLFQEVVDAQPGEGQFEGMEFLHVRARRVINEVPAASRMPFRYTINAYRGCSHACVYCQGPDTPILMADGRHRPIAEVRLGDEVYGTERLGAYRRYVTTEVRAHWQTVKPAFRVVLADGTELVASGDHRFLTGRGWKFVTGTGCGANQRPHLTLNNELLGTGAFSAQPNHCADYRAGYLSGMIRGDGTIGHRTYRRVTGREWTSHQFRLALADLDALRRTRLFLTQSAVTCDEFRFQQVVGGRAEMWAIRNQSAAGVEAVEAAIRWPATPIAQWSRGFLAGIFDAEGSYSRGILRISNCDLRIIDEISAALRRFGFRYMLETRPGVNKPVHVVRLLGGLVEHLRFFHTTDPAITRKRSIEGQAIKTKADLRVKAIEPLGIDLPMYDLTTGTGDFIANGVVSHNCFARPTHEYLGLNIGDDFERRIVVKVNAVERVRAELSSAKWGGDHIAMGTNTDPYQRCEGKYRLTRGIIAALGEAANPFSILTKSTLILRDLDVLVAAAARADVRTSFSIGTLDEEVWRATEPGTPHPRQRVAAVRRLNQAGIPCGVLVAPILPGLSDRPEQIDEVVSACLDAGAVGVTGILLHLRPGVKEHYLDWLATRRSDLIPTYDRLFPKAYAPAGESRRMANLVEQAVQRHGGLRATPVAARRAWSRDHPSPPELPPRPAGVQLELL